MPEPEQKRSVLLWLAAEAVIPVLGGCAGALAGGPLGGVAGVAVGHAVEKAINLFGKGIVERWQAWFAGHRPEAEAAVAALAAMPPAEAKAVAKAIIVDLAPAAPAEDVAFALEFLSALPSAVNRAMVPTGGGKRGLPATVTLDDPRSLLQLLPENLPPYVVPADLLGTPYRLVELLGAGGFGAVYKAVSASLQHLPLAIKFCLDRSLLPGLHRERSSLERLMKAGGAGSEHVVRLFGYDLDHATPYLVYEYVGGGTLVQLLSARMGATGAVPDPTEVLLWVTQIAKGLAFAHQAGLVHRDLKPANVMIENSAAPVLKLTDFGLGGVTAARAAARNPSGSSALDAMSAGEQASLFRGAGTPLYMSPEQRRGADPDPRHDLYALGVVWYQLLTGDVSRELHPGWAKELAVKYRVPASYLALIERCVGWIEERPRDAAELLPLLRDLPMPVSTGAPRVVLPPDVEPAAETMTGRAAVTQRGWSGAIHEILADPIQKPAFITHFRSLLQVLTRTEKNLQANFVLSIVLPCVFGVGPAVAVSVPTSLTGVLPVWIAVSLGLLVGAALSGVMLLFLWILRRAEITKQTAAVNRFAAAYPALAERCGGPEGLRNRELVQSILLAVDDLPKPGLFRRLFGG